MPPMWSSGKNVANKKIKPKFFNIKKNKSLLKSISFKIHKYNDKNDSFPKLFFSCFCEFGCESLLPTYLIPRINKNFPDHKKIVLGWQGREYFYKHLVDEFWEIDPKCMNLREKCKAFMHNSKELSSLEDVLSKKSVVVDGKKLGNLCVSAACYACQSEFAVGKTESSCMNCGSTNIKKSLFQGVKEYKNYIKFLPRPSSSLSSMVENLIPSNSVALFARNRKAYGRNFTAEHYRKIIDVINDIGYNVVLLGEPVSSLNFKHPNVVNLLNHRLAGNLEFAFAVVERCVFSLQLYTASTRISSLLDVPYILVESPDQIYGRGQEGIRLSLTTRNDKKKKLILSNYINTLENFDKFLNTFELAVRSFMFENNNDDIFFNCEEVGSIYLKSGSESLW
jgi:hypothetical protein